MFETKRPFGVDDDGNFLLLTNFFVIVAMDAVVNKWKSLIGQNKKYSSLNLARKLYTANELIFAEYWEFHACRKREIKSGYQRWYRVNRSRNCFFPMSSLIGPEIVDRVMWHWADWSSWQLKTFEHLSMSFLVSWSWAMLEAQDLWSHLIAFDVNLSLVEHQGQYTLVYHYSFSWSELTVDEDSMKFQLRV